MSRTIPGHMARLRFSLQEPVARPLILATMFVAAFCLRLYGIGAPPMDFQGVRQYHGALLARGLYEWLLTGDLKTIPPDGFIEPPIVEFLASLCYVVLEGEHLWVPRLLSALFWMVGGVFLYRIAKRLVSANAAIFSVFFYLFSPAILLASRAFMPDPLMVMLLVISVFTILRYHEEPSTRWLVIAAVTSSLAVFVKPGICAFQVFGAFAALAVYRQGFRKTLLSPHLLLFTAFAALPTGLYYWYGTFVAGFFQGQVEDKVLLELILRETFWKRWFQNAGDVVGYVALGCAVLGVLSSRTGVQRALLAGLWGGYFLLGLVFTFHITTHDYYQLPLIPVVALSLGAAWDSVAGWLVRMGPRRHGRAFVLAVCLLAVSLAVHQQRMNIFGPVQQGQGDGFPGRYVGHTVLADYEYRAETYRKIGAHVHHSPRTIFLAPDFGFSLLYHGRLGGDPWPLAEREKRAQKHGASTPRAKDLLETALLSERPPEYFIVIKRFVSYNKMEDWEDEGYRGLSRVLTRRFSVAAEDDHYVVFDLKSKGGQDERAHRPPSREIQGTRNIEE